ncbi:MAG TPA: pseudaminic acid cytidylyltransferase [Bacteroidota bacterium]|nr:pseudaminic acid cytidylyltransferase [Bacteroidota bacterium]
MKTLAVIPARGGSKRIPGKNVRPFLGKPIISYPIRAALDAGIFDEVMVSTDDREVAEIAKSFGARVPFLRSRDSSDDYSNLTDVLREVVGKYEEEGKLFEMIALIYATAPLLTADRIREGFDLLRKGTHNAVLYVVRFGHPAQRAMIINSGRLSFLYPENAGSRSQDLQATYHDAGQLLWITRDAFLREKILPGSDAYAVELPAAEVQDIDTIEDWEMAEHKYRFLSTRNKQ